MKIKQDKKLNKVIAIFGVVILVMGLIILVTGPSSGAWARASSLCTGLGFGAICGGLGGLYGIRKLRKDPAKFKQIEIERKDERNTFIKCRAKATSGEILNWMVIVIAYACIVMNSPSWTTMSLLVIFILKYIFEIILANQYAKKF